MTTAGCLSPTLPCVGVCQYTADEIGGGRHEEIVTGVDDSHPKGECRVGGALRDHGCTVRLIERTTHHVRLSPAGSAFLIEARKILAHVDCLVMVDPSRVPGEHSVFVAGEDATAKDVARDLLGTFGWKDADVVDLGGIRAARGTEMYLPLWLSLLQVIGSGDFNINVVRA